LPILVDYSTMLPGPHEAAGARYFEPPTAL
jgi:hypothetical protein